MIVVVRVGDLLDESADAIITTANPFLNMSGGVNGAILLRGGAAVQEELRELLRSAGTPHVPPGSVHVTSAGPLSATYLLHAVAIDAFYDSSVALVTQTITAAFVMASTLGCATLAMPALATGYGPLSLEEFGDALVCSLRERIWKFATLTIVIRRTEEVEPLQRRIDCLSH